MQLAITQINCMLGDLAGNAAQILAYAERARLHGATLLLTPKLSVCGYLPHIFSSLATSFTEYQEAAQ